MTRSVSRIGDVIVRAGNCQGTHLHLTHCRLLGCAVVGVCQCFQGDRGSRNAQRTDGILLSDRTGIVMSSSYRYIISAHITVISVGNGVIKRRHCITVTDGDSRLLDIAVIRKRGGCRQCHHIRSQ